MGKSDQSALATTTSLFECNSDDKKALNFICSTVFRKGNCLDIELYRYAIIQKYYYAEMIIVMQMYGISVDNNNNTEYSDLRQFSERFSEYTCIQC